MIEKKKSFVDREAYIHNSKDDISDALYLAIKSRNLPYTKDTLSRVTTCVGNSGDILLQHFLDIDTPNQIQLTEVRFITALDEEVSVDRVHVQYFKGKGSVPFLATA